MMQACLSRALNNSRCCILKLAKETVFVKYIDAASFFVLENESRSFREKKLNTLMAFFSDAVIAVLSNERAAWLCHYALVICK